MKRLEYRSTNFINDICHLVVYYNSSPKYNFDLSVTEVKDTLNYIHFCENLEHNLPNICGDKKCL